MPEDIHCSEHACAAASDMAARGLRQASWSGKGRETLGQAVDVACAAAKLLAGWELCVEFVADACGLGL